MCYAVRSYFESLLCSLSPCICRLGVKGPLKAFSSALQRAWDETSDKSPPFLWAPRHSWPQHILSHPWLCFPARCCCWGQGSSGHPALGGSGGTSLHPALVQSAACSIWNKSLWFCCQTLGKSYPLQVPQCLLCLASLTFLLRVCTKKNQGPQSHFWVVKELLLPSLPCLTLSCREQIELQIPGEQDGLMIPP